MPAESYTETVISNPCSGCSFGTARVCWYECRNVLSGFPGNKNLLATVDGCEHFERQG